MGNVSSWSNGCCSESYEVRRTTLTTVIANDSTEVQTPRAIGYTCEP